MSGKTIKGFAQLFKGKALSVFGVDRMASEQKSGLWQKRALNLAEKLSMMILMLLKRAEWIF